MDPRRLGKPFRLIPPATEATPVSSALQPSTSADIRKLVEVRQEPWRRLCRGNLLACATALLEPRGYTPARHHELFCGEIESVVRGQHPRLILIVRAAAPNRHTPPTSRRHGCSPCGLVRGSLL